MRLFGNASENIVPGRLHCPDYNGDCLCGRGGRSRTGGAGSGCSGKRGAAAAPAEPRAEQPKAPAKRSERLFATPRAKTAAAEHGVDLRGIVPSGPEGLIIERDVLAHMRGAGKPVSGAAPCILSAQISLFRDEAVSPETVLRLAYRKAAEQTGLSCARSPA